MGQSVLLAGSPVIEDRFNNFFGYSSLLSC